MRASLFATLLLAVSVIAPALASPISIRDSSDVVQRRAPLAARDPNPNNSYEDKKKNTQRQQSNEERRSTKASNDDPEPKAKAVPITKGNTPTTH
ncbi:hypothetical protein V8E53_012292 [Lactarius tabidus]